MLRTNQSKHLQIALVLCMPLFSQDFNGNTASDLFSDVRARVAAPWSETLDASSLPLTQAGVPVRGPGGGDQPSLPRLLRGARRVPPAARPAALQLRRLQRQIPAPVPLQGLPQRPGGAV